MADLAVGDMVLLSLEGEQFCVDLILMCGGDAVRRSREVDVLRALDELCRLHCRILHRNDLVVLAVKHQVGTSNFLRSSVKSVSEKALILS